jgi:hypothetical protein
MKQMKNNIFTMEKCTMSFFPFASDKKDLFHDLVISKIIKCAPHQVG